jgi:spoIIIJ-associated protein
MEYKEFEGRSVDDAIVQAMRAFRVSFEDLDIQILVEASKGFLGMGGKNAKIKARLATASDNDSPVDIDDTSSEMPESQTGEEILPSSKEVPEQILIEMKTVLNEILAKMQIENFEVQLRNDGVLEITGDGSGLLIGKHGQTLDALQFIINRIANKDRQDMVHITIDTEKYRERHIERLKSMAVKMGQKARKTGKSVSLEMMNPYDRRIIHLTLKSEPDLNTRSIGEGVFKKVVIQPKTRKQPR